MENEWLQYIVKNYIHIENIHLLIDFTISSAIWLAELSEVDRKELMQ